MKNQFAEQNESKNRRPFLLILLTLTLLLASLSGAAQQTKPNETLKVSENWEITFGGIYGRYRQSTDFYKLNGNGQGTFEEDEGAFGGKPASRRRGSKQIPAEAVAEIGELIKQLDLANAKTRPEKKGNACRPSAHLGKSYFTLIIDNKTYSFTFCIGYENPIVLSPEQQKTLQQLKAKIRSYFDEKEKPTTTAEVRPNK